MFCSYSTRLVRHVQIYKHKFIYQLYLRQKLNNDLHAEKSLDNSSIFLHDNTFEETMNRRIITQHNKDYIQQAHT